MRKKITTPDQSKKITEIYEFISNPLNRIYNKQIQLGFIETWIGDINLDLQRKVLNLLFNVLNTQSQLNIENAALFFKKINKDNNHHTSFLNFCKCISEDRDLNKSDINFEFAFKILEKQKGWGPKTAALFLKVIFEIHNGRFKEFGFWEDVPEMKNNDKLYLPVDQVIAYIFKEIFNKTLSFTQINSILSENYKGEEILIWDDLWFWGYISQNSQGNERKVTEFNSAKYWTLLNSPKDEKTINEISKQVLQFLNILK